MKQDIQIIIATHKKYRMPDDSMYLPLQVGAEGKNEDLGYVKDNTGDNISALNSNYCELTGLYWAWKNIHTDYIGLVHYRRYFSIRKKSQDPFQNVLTYGEIKPYLGPIKIFVPSKRKYYIESLYSHYAHSHYSEHLDKAREIIKGKYPDYISSFDKIMNEKSGYMFNMMIMKRNLLDLYCNWLFDILFELQNRIDATNLSPFQGRLYGRVSELLFNVWLDYQVQTNSIGESEIMSIRCIHMERINWIKKGSAFLKAKFFGNKYEGSF